MGCDRLRTTTTRRGLLRGVASSVVGASLLGGLSSDVSASAPSDSEALPEATTDAEVEARNTIRVESDGGGVATYEFDVRGSVRQVDSGDEVWSGSVYGHVGPKRGTDMFDYTGTVTHFRLAGPATVYANGYRL